ncbi:MAG TPA: hypothetical protein VFW40_06785 [Capsulimonadaceae bacterium]|nr:hypothetical protein [Capsulimonadaceae bacterium]
MTLEGTSTAWAAEFTPDASQLIIVQPLDEFSAEALHPIHLWDTKTWQVRAAVGVGSAYVHAVKFAPNGKLVAVSTGPDHRISLWSGDFLQKVSSFVPRDSPTFGLDFSSNGRILATAGSDNKARLWDVSSGKLLCEFTHREFAEVSEYPNSVLCATISPNNQVLVAGGLDGIVSIWPIPDTGEGSVATG